MFYKDFIFIYIPNLEIGEEMPPMLDFPIEKQSICFSPLNNEYIDFLKNNLVFGVECVCVYMCVCVCEHTNLDIGEIQSFVICH